MIRMFRARHLSPARPLCHPAPAAPVVSTSRQLLSRSRLAHPTLRTLNFQSHRWPGEQAELRAPVGIRTVECQLPLGLAGGSGLITFACANGLHLSAQAAAFLLGEHRLWVRGETGATVDIEIAPELDAVLTRLRGASNNNDDWSPAPNVVIGLALIHRRDGKPYTYVGLCAMLKRRQAAVRETHMANKGLR